MSRRRAFLKHFLLFHMRMMLQQCVTALEAKGGRARQQRCSLVPQLSGSAVGEHASGLRVQRL